VRPFFRGELRTLSAEVTAAMPRAKDRETRMHLDDVKDQIAKALDPKIAPLLTSTTTGMPRGFDLLEEWQNPHTCWPDYQIKK
jgi:hypothetical protein